MDSTVRQSKLSAPLAHALGFPIVCEELRAAGILSLLKVGFPSAIIGFIISIIVFSSHREIETGSATHIGHEVRESIFSEPPVANLDTAPTVSGVVFIPFIETSRLDGSPATELSLEFSSFAGHSMGFICDSDSLFVITPARGCVSAGEMGRKNDGLFPAFAAAFPKHPASSGVFNAMREINDEQSPV